MKSIAKNASAFALTMLAGLVSLLWPVDSSAMSVKDWVESCRSESKDAQTQCGFYYAGVQEAFRYVLENGTVYALDDQLVNGPACIRFLFPDKGSSDVPEKVFRMLSSDNPVLQKGWAEMSAGYAITQFISTMCNKHLAETQKK